MRTYARWLHFFFFGVVLELLDEYSAVLLLLCSTRYGQNRVYTHGISSAPPRVEVVSGLAREDNVDCAQEHDP